jgi:drug/metabolite transporter (DMT)-like permease
MVSALRHLPATHVAVVAMLEPVLASIIAWAIHDQALAVIQVAGGAIVLTAIAWLQTHGPSSLHADPAVRSGEPAAEPVPTR